MRFRPLNSKLNIKMPQNNSRSSILEYLAKLIGVIGAISLTGSLFYDWGFYKALGLSFLEIPSSISDHVRSALLWFPKIVIISIITIVQVLLYQRFEAGGTKEEIFAHSNEPDRTLKFHSSYLKIVMVISITPALGYFLIGDQFLRAIPLAAVSSWVLLPTGHNLLPQS